MAAQTTEELIAEALAGNDATISSSVTVSDGESLKSKAASGHSGC